MPIVIFCQCLLNNFGSYVIIRHEVKSCMAINSVEMGNRARDIRVSKNIKQIEISKALGITQPCYSRFENGLYDMPISQIIKLCEILGVSVSWLIGEDIDFIAGLSDNERLLVEDFIKYIKKIRKKLL